MKTSDIGKETFDDILLEVDTFYGDIDINDYDRDRRHAKRGIRRKIVTKKSESENK